MTIMNDYTRESLKIPVEKSITGMRVTQEVSELIKIRGKPEEIVSDNGTEFTCNAVLKWAQEKKVKWSYIQPVGNPCKTVISRASMESSEMNV